MGSRQREPITRTPTTGNTHSTYRNGAPTEGFTNDPMGVTEGFGGLTMDSWVKNGNFCVKYQNKQQKQLTQHYTPYTYLYV